jgi:hypothetical protein
MSWIRLTPVRKYFAALTLLLLTSLVPFCEAQFKVTENFNRPDGDVGVGWSAWGGGAELSGYQLETFGEDRFGGGGGVARKLAVTFPLKFSFDFSTDSPPNGGWQIGFNAAASQKIPLRTSEFGVQQLSGRRGICLFFQTTNGPALECAQVVSGQRDYTARAHISAVVNDDWSVKIAIKYNDGLGPDTVLVQTPRAETALTSPLGNLLLLGSLSEDYGPHYFDNFMLSLN